MRPFVIVMIAFLLTAGVGCGGDDEGTGDRTVSTTTPEIGPGPDLGLIEDGTLTVGSNIPYSPFEEGDPPDYEGFDIDLINAIADDLDLETKIEAVPFDLILEGGGDRFDVAISAVEITPARERSLDFSNPYFVSSVGLLVQEDTGIESIADIRRTTVVAVESGTDAAKYVTHNLTASKVEAFPSSDDASNALYSGDVDAVIADADVVEEAAATREGLEVAEIIPTDEELGIVVPKGRGPLLNAVDAALRGVKNDGTLSELYDDYFGIEAPEALLKTGRAED